MKNIFTALALLFTAEIISTDAMAITDALRIRIARGSYSDETIIRFVDGATVGFDGSYDAWKLFSSNASVPNIFTKDIINDELTINAMPKLAASVSMDVFLKIGTAGTYSITPEETGVFASGVCILIKDLSTGQVYDMRTSATYTVSLPVIAQTAPPRFRVFFSLPGTVTYVSVANGSWSNPATWSAISCSATASAIPDSISNVVISAGTNVTLDASTTCINLSNCGTLVTNASLTVKGDCANNGTFSSGTQTVTFKGNSMQSISGSSATAFNNLTINNSTPSEALHLYSPVTVNGILGLKDGHITTTTSNILSCGVAASVSLLCTPQDSSFVKGPMNWKVNVSTGVTLVFPVGKDNCYRRIDLTVDQQTTTATTYTAEMVNNSANALGYSLPSTLSNVSQVRYHTIAQSPSTAIDMAQVRIYFGCAGINDNVSSLPPISVAKDNGSNTWLDLSDTPNGYSCGSTYWGNDLSGTFTSFTGTKFTLGNTGPPVFLEVTLMNFNANAAGETVETSWVTASESNSDYFTLERSTDGQRYEAIGQIPAAGNSSEERNYRVNDESPVAGISYYRLMETDKNGRSTYSHVVSVNMENENSINVYPNPASDYLIITLSNSKEKESVVAIKDILGRVCYSQKVIPVSDNETIRINLDEKFSSGVYMVTALSAEKISEQKIIIH
ncbi:MAG: T9SS type A sorting domain-containing protein [Bacteroidetes bacterium]|nr:T9SS type A sorting domain-containing protein [Bacteroidota bacterium]